MLTLNFASYAKKKRFNEAQIVAAIKKQEAAIAVKDICRELDISEATFYN